MNHLTIAETRYRLYTEKMAKDLALKLENEEKLRKKQRRPGKKRKEEAKAREGATFDEPDTAREPVIVLIGDREVDISSTDIDPRVFEASPDDAGGVAWYVKAQGAKQEISQPSGRHKGR